MSNAPVASYSLTVRVRIVNSPGMLGKVTSAIGAEGGDIGGIDIVEAGREMTRDISFKASDEAVYVRELRTLLNE
jgi:malate dehydrogenase (oxaloacetate-decarboxylating)